MTKGVTKGVTTARESWDALGPALVDVFDSVRTPFALLSTDLRYVAVNPSYCEIVGRSVDELVGQIVFDVFPEPERPASTDEEALGLRHSLELVLSTGAPHTMPLLRYDMAAAEGRPPIERYWHVTNVPIPNADGTPWMVLNHPEELTDYIDERVRSQAIGEGSAPVSSSSQAQAVDSVFTAIISRLENLNDLASALVGATDSDGVGAAVLRHGLAMVGADGGAFVTVDGDRFTMMDQRGMDLEMAERWKTFTVTEGAEPFSDSLCDGMPRFFPTREVFLDAYPSLAEDLADHSHEAWAVLPLRIDGRVTGAIGLVYDEPTEFGDALRLAMYTLANLATQASARARLIEEQAAAMQSIEASLRPSLDLIDGIVVTDLYRAASVITNAGGDWYDVIQVSERCTLIAIGDVANHGPAAVGEMARTRATVHALALQGLGPEEIATQANLVLSRIASTFTTSIVAVHDAETNMLTWTTAGHPYPLLRTRDGSAQFLSYTHGPPLGAGVDAEYASTARLLEPGDTFVLFTDGLVERADESIDDGLERLRLVAEKSEVTDRYAEDLYEQLIDTDRHNDDVAVLTLHRAR